MKKKFQLILIIIFPLCGFAQINTNNVIHNGRSRLYFGNYTGAIENFNMVIKLKPYLPEPYFYRGAAKLNLEDFRGALEDLNKALEIKPYFPDALMYRGMIYYNLKEYDKAMQDYSKAMNLDSENADIYNNRGICKAAMRDIDGAIKDYTKSIELKPKNFNAYLNRSIAYQINEEQDKAISDCNQLIRIRPNSPMGYMSRGLIKIEKEDYAGAMRDFDMAIYLDPRNAFALQNRGLVKQKLSSYEAAIMDYDAAIAIDNRMASAYFNRGIAKEMIGMEGYQKDYDYASLLDPRYEKRPWQTSEERKQAKQQQMQAWQQSQQQKQQKNNSHSNSIETDSLLTQKENIDTLNLDLKALRKRKMKANLVVEDIREIPGKEKSNKGKVQNKNIDITLLPLFEVATINNSNNTETVGYFSMIIENLNAINNYQPYLTLTNKINDSKTTINYYRNQILIFDQKIEQNKKLSNNYLYRGIFKALLNNFDEAINDFDEAINIDERNLLAYFMRANTRVQMIETIQNIAGTKVLVTRQQDYKQLFVEDNNDLQQSNDALNDVFTDYSVVIYMNPDFPFGYFNRGNIYCKNERYLSALDEYNRAIQTDPDFAEAYYNRGLVRILLNDINGGAKDLSMAGELGIEESYNVIKRYCN